MSHIIKREWVLEFVHFLLFGENTMLLESGAWMYRKLRKKFWENYVRQPSKYFRRTPWSRAASKKGRSGIKLKTQIFISNQRKNH